MGGPLSRPFFALGLLALLPGFEGRSSLFVKPTCRPGARLRLLSRTSPLLTVTRARWTVTVPASRSTSRQVSPHTSPLRMPVQAARRHMGKRRSVVTLRRNLSSSSRVQVLSSPASRVSRSTFGKAARLRGVVRNELLLHCVRECIVQGCPDPAHGGRAQRLAFGLWPSLGLCCPRLPPLRASRTGSRSSRV
jgi:hypothetical protein